VFRQKGTNIKTESYRCPSCGFWHIGRHKTTKLEKHITRYNDKREEIIVGKLVGTLKKLLNKEGK